MASSLTDQDPAALDVDSGTAKVITEVLRRETLLKTGTWQNALVSSADFSIIATDAKGLIQLFNVGAERMLGYAAAEVVNEITPANFSDPQEMVARAEALSLELATPIAPGFEALVCKASRGIEDIYELTYILKDGSRFPALVSVTALYDAHSAVVGYLLIGTDNTARKKFDGESQKLARRLRAQQVHTRSLIESHSDALMTTDPSGIITDANEPMEALTGCTRAELIGAAFKSCFTDPERADTAIQEVLRENKVTDYVLTVRARDGKTTMVSYSASTFHGRDGALLGVLATVRDVTECERSAQTLPEASDELERARAVAETTARAQSDFLSSMSAELRVSLKQILGVAQLLASGSPRPAPSRNKGIVQILRAGRYLLNLINEVFDPATVEEAVALPGTRVAGRSHAPVPGPDRTAGAGARSQHHLSPTRPALLRPCRSDPREADSLEPPFQRGQAQPPAGDGRSDVYRERPGTRAHRCQGRWTRIAARAAGSTPSDFRPPRARGQLRGR